MFYLVVWLTDVDSGTIHRECTKLPEDDSCSTIPMIPGIGIGNNTVCHCSTDLCNASDSSDLLPSVAMMAACLIVLSYADFMAAFVAVIFETQFDLNFS